jgi:hypothetical protein
MRIIEKAIVTGGCKAKLINRGVGSAFVCSLSPIESESLSEFDGIYGTAQKEC